MNNQNIVRLDENSRELIECIRTLYNTLLGQKGFYDMKISIKDIINASLNTQKEKLEWRWLNGNYPEQKNIFLLTDETKNMLQELHRLQTRYAYKHWNTDELVPCEEVLIREAIKKELKEWKDTMKENEDDQRA